MNGILSSVKSFLKNFRLHWRQPAPGRYMPYREIMSLSVGGIGVRMIVWCVNQMILSTGNTLIGNTIGIAPTPLYVIYIISLISAFPLTAIRASMIDNARSAKGKYRPYILRMGVPTAVLGALFIWMPYEHMSMAAKCAVVLAFNIAFQFFYSFFVDAYESLVNVLSPNSIERSDVLSVRSVVENLSPSIVNILFPLLARAITGQNTLFDLRVFRYLFPPMLFAGLAISILVYINTKEKVVRSRAHYIRVSFGDALRAVARNKYFWIISLAGWIGFLEGAFNNVLQWMYHYQNACSAGQYAVITAIAGNASFWPNLAAPFLIRRFGKKRILIATNALNILFILLMLPIVRASGTPHIIWALLGCLFVNQFITSLGHLLTPGVNADIRDYQQYVTGERIDGMFAAIGLIGNVITIATGTVIPMLYEQSGLNAATAVALGYGAENVYDVLYDPAYFARICSVLVIASVAGAALNLIPYFFYDLSEKRQQAMIRVLKVRAAFEDLDAGIAEGDTLREAVAVLDELESPNADPEVSSCLRAEFAKYETEAGKLALRAAEAIVSAGENGMAGAVLPDGAEIRAVKAVTPEEKSCVSFVRLLRSETRAAVRTAKRFFPNGIEPFDESVLTALYEEQDRLETRIAEELRLAAEKASGGDRRGAKEQRGLVKGLRQQAHLLETRVKETQRAYDRCRRCVKPYLDAERVLRQSAHYRAPDELRSAVPS